MSREVIDYEGSSFCKFADQTVTIVKAHEVFDDGSTCRRLPRIDNVVEVCWQRHSWHTADTARLDKVPFFRLVTLLGPGETVQIVQFCLRANPRTPEQEEVLGWFYEHYQPLVRREVLAACHRANLSAEPDDLCQEVWLTINEALPEWKYDPVLGSVSGWIVVVTRRTVCHCGRRLGRSCTCQPVPIESFEDSLPSPDLGPEDVCLMKEIEEQMAASLAELRMRISLKSYEVLCLRCFGKQSSKEVAALLGMTSEAVDTRCCRAMSEWQSLTRGSALPEYSADFKDACAP